MHYNNGEIRLNKYRFEELIGKGAFAEVYPFTHLSLKMSRAMDVLIRHTPA